MTVSITHAQPAVRLAVRDGSHQLPATATASSLANGGRGLRLVETLSTSWGAVPLEQGKVVWAVLDGRGETPTEWA